MTAETKENSPAVNDEATDSHATDGDGHSRPSYDDINSSAIIVTGLISALFTFLTIAFVQGLYYQWNGTYVRERSTEYANDPIEKVIEDQKNELAGNEELGTISIEKAMEKVLAEYAQNDSNEKSSENE